MVRPPERLRRSTFLLTKDLKHSKLAILSLQCNCKSFSILRQLDSLEHSSLENGQKRARREAAAGFCQSIGTSVRKRLNFFI